jgi:hypothetical protein
LGLDGSTVTGIEFPQFTEPPGGLTTPGTLKVHRSRGAAAIVVSVIVALAAGAQVGSSLSRSSAATTIAPVSACVKGSGVFVLGAGRRCKHGVVLTWNKAGPPGQRGPTGAEGSAGAQGPAGDQGAHGDAGPAGVFGSKLENAAGLSCNNGAGTITVQFDSTTGLERFVCH